MMAQNKGYTEQQIIATVRKVPAPRDLQTLLFTPNLKLQDILSIINDWEEMQSKKLNYRNERKQIGYKPQKRSNRMNNRNISEIRDVRCYRCGELRHISSDCPIRKKCPKVTNLALNGKQNDERSDESK